MLRLEKGARGSAKPKLNFPKYCRSTERKKISMGYACSLIVKEFNEALLARALMIIIRGLHLTSIYTAAFSGVGSMAVA